MRGKASIVLLTLASTICVVSSVAQCQTQVDADDANIQYIGRFKFANPKEAAFDWPGVYINAVFEGTSLGIRLDAQQCSFNVFIDDKLTILDPTGSQTYPVAQGLTKGTHRVLVVSRNGGGKFMGLVLDKGKKLRRPPARPKRRIEFIGDSFSAGSSNEAVSATQPANMFERTNAYTAFGPVTARHFKADYSLIAMPGIGLIGGSFPFHMPDIYQRTLAGGSENDWDFSKWQPDVVVCYLGLNDGLGSQERLKLYEDGCVAFLTTIRSKYPKAEIICIWNGSPLVLNGVSNAVKRLGDAKMHAANLNADLSKGGTGPMDTFHPNNMGHQRMAEKLIELINGVTHWDGAGK